MNDLIKASDALADALEPFANEATWWFEKNYGASDVPVEGFDDYQGVMTCGDLFTARVVLTNYREARDVHEEGLRVRSSTGHSEGEISQIDQAAIAYDGVLDQLRSEPCAFKRAAFRAGWNAAIQAAKEVSESYQKPPNNDIEEAENATAAVIAHDILALKGT